MTNFLMRSLKGLLTEVFMYGVVDTTRMRYHNGFVYQWDIHRCVIFKEYTGHRSWS